MNVARAGFYHKDSGKTIRKPRDRFPYEQFDVPDFLFVRWVDSMNERRKELFASEEDSAVQNEVKFNSGCSPDVSGDGSSCESDADEPVFIPYYVKEEPCAAEEGTSGDSGFDFSDDSSGTGGSSSAETGDRNMQDDSLYEADPDDPDVVAGFEPVGCSGEVDPCVTCASGYPGMDFQQSDSSESSGEYGDECIIDDSCCEEEPAKAESGDDPTYLPADDAVEKAAWDAMPSLEPAREQPDPSGDWSDSGDFSAYEDSSESESPWDELDELDEVDRHLDLAEKNLYEFLSRSKSEIGKKEDIIGDNDVLVDFSGKLSEGSVSFCAGPYIFTLLKEGGSLKVCVSEGQTILTLVPFPLNESIPDFTFGFHGFFFNMFRSDRTDRLSVVITKMKGDVLNGDRE